MSSYLFITIFIIGNFMILINSATPDQIDNNVLPTMTEYEVPEVNKFCLTFPPTDCFENDNPDELKNDVELFQEQFCLNRRSFHCIEQFALRCFTSINDYYNLISNVLSRSHAVLKLEMCTNNGPYSDENLKHADCLRFGKMVYNGKCPEKFEDGRNNVTSIRYTLEKYVHCVINIVAVTCGMDTAMFLSEYMHPFNISMDDSNPLPVINLAE